MRDEFFLYAEFLLMEVTIKGDILNHQQFTVPCLFLAPTQKTTLWCDSVLAYRLFNKKKLALIFKGPHKWETRILLWCFNPFDLFSWILPPRPDLSPEPCELAEAHRVYLRHNRDSTPSADWRCYHHFHPWHHSKTWSVPKRYHRPCN